MENLTPVYVLDGTPVRLAEKFSGPYTNYGTNKNNTYKADSLNSVTEKATVNANGYRLPGKAEWRYAAKGGQNTKYAGTNSESELVKYTWVEENSEDESHDVGLKLPNGYGLKDMIGNAYEWVYDISEINSKARLQYGVSYDLTTEIDDDTSFAAAYVNTKASGFRVARNAN